MEGHETIEIELKESSYLLDRYIEKDSERKQKKEKIKQDRQQHYGPNKALELSSSILDTSDFYAIEIKLLQTTTEESFLLQFYFKRIYISFSFFSFFSLFKENLFIGESTSKK